MRKGPAARTVGHAAARHVHGSDRLYGVFNFRYGKFIAAEFYLAGRGSSLDPGLVPLIAGRLSYPPRTVKWYGGYSDSRARQRGATWENLTASPTSLLSLKARIGLLTRKIILWGCVSCGALFMAEHKPAQLYCRCGCGVGCSCSARARSTPLGLS